MPVFPPPPVVYQCLQVTAHDQAAAHSGLQPRLSLGSTLSQPVLQAPGLAGQLERDKQVQPVSPEKGGHGRASDGATKAATMPLPPTPSPTKAATMPLPPTSSPTKAATMPLPPTPSPTKRPFEAAAATPTTPQVVCCLRYVIVIRRMENRCAVQSILRSMHTGD